MAKVTARMIIFVAGTERGLPPRMLAVLNVWLNPIARTHHTTRTRKAVPGTRGTPVISMEIVIISPSRSTQLEVPFFVTTFVSAPKNWPIFSSSWISECEPQLYI